MSFFDFGPKPTTITTTFTPLGGRPFTTTFTAPSGIIPTGSNPFPKFNDFLPAVSDNDCGPGGKVIPPGLGGSGPPGLDHQGGPLCSGSPGPTANASPGSPPLNPSSTASATDSSGTSSSQSSQESVSTTTEHSAVTSSTRGSDQPPSSTKSTDSTTGGFTATSSSEGSSTSTSTSASVVVVVSSYPSLPAESLSTSSTSVSTSTQSSPATAAASSASGLSAGSAVGIALGAFVAAILLVVAALFLFLRQRKRRRDRYAAKRKLRWSEGGRSRALSSIWSWFGSLPIGSEFDIGSTAAQEHKDARRASQRLDDSRSEDPFQDMESNSDRSATMVAHGALSHPAASTVHVHEGVEQAHAPPSQCGHEREGMEGAARLLALAATDYSASGALPFSSYTNPAASGLRAGHVSPDGHQVMADSERGRMRVQEARDPFADPRPLSRVSQTLTVASSTEVQSVEAQ